MKLRTTLVFGVMALTLAAAPSFAGNMQQIGVTAGFASPTGDFGKAAGSGWLAGATYCYGLNSMWGIGLDANYYGFGSKSFDDGLGGSEKIQPTLVQVTAHVKYFFPMKGSKMMPYVKGGLGIYDLSEKATGTFLGNSISATNSSSNFGFNLGLGDTWSMGSKSSWGLEALYHIISSSSSNGSGSSSANMFTVAANYNWGLGK